MVVTKARRVVKEERESREVAESVAVWTLEEAT
jgi:hypothetical protein